MFNSKHLNLHLDVLKHKYICECDKKVKQTLFYTLLDWEGKIHKYIVTGKVMKI